MVAIEPILSIIESRQRAYTGRNIYRILFLQPQGQTLRSWRRERVPACSRQEDDDMKIHTEQRMLVRDLLVIGPDVQSLTASFGRCLARFEALLARRARDTQLHHRAYELRKFATSFRANNCQARPCQRLARHRAVIGSCAAHPGRCSVAQCAFRTVCCGQYPLILHHCWNRPSNEI
jgi:hypothetical protein